MAQAQISSFSTELTRKQKLFYVATDLHYIHKLFSIFHFYATSEQFFNAIVPGIPLPESNKDFFLERCHKSTTDKWMLLFKYLLKHHSLIDVGQMLYEGFITAGLIIQYFNLAKKEEKLFLMAAISVKQLMIK